MLGSRQLERQKRRQPFDMGWPVATFTAASVPSEMYNVQVRARSPCGCSVASNEVAVLGR
jgi:hypothetical protein